MAYLSEFICPKKSLSFVNAVYKFSMQWHHIPLLDLLFSIMDCFILFVSEPFNMMWQVFWSHFQEVCEPSTWTITAYVIQSHLGELCIVALLWQC